MKKNNPIIASFLLLLFLNSCGTVAEGLGGSKKNGNEEFLVEKKSPLVMPPDFDELPIPNQEKVIKENRKSGIKSLLIGSKDKTDIEETDQNISPIEKLILKQIKKN